MVTCAQVRTIHLNAKTVPNQGSSRGVAQRNAALAWIHKHCESTENKPPECVEGVVYFMDDDNQYDYRLFKEVSCRICSRTIPSKA